MEPEKKYNFSDKFDYDGVIYIRECHSNALYGKTVRGGIHWHKVTDSGDKEWQTIQGDLLIELEQQFIRGEKLKRILNGTDI